MTVFTSCRTVCQGDGTDPTTCFDQGQIQQLQFANGRLYASLTVAESYSEYAARDLDNWIINLASLDTKS